MVMELHDVGPRGHLRHLREPADGGLGGVLAPPTAPAGPIAILDNASAMHGASCDGTAAADNGTVEAAPPALAGAAGPAASRAPAPASATFAMGVRPVGNAQPAGAAVAGARFVFDVTDSASVEYPKRAASVDYPQRTAGRVE